MNLHLGVISGGGNRPLKGKMGSSVAAKDEITAEQLQRMEQDAKKLEEGTCFSLF